MASAKSFMLYFDNREQFEMMSDAQAGELIKALFAFAETGEAPELSDGMVKIAFSFISSQISRDTEKYENICKKRAESVKKRWDKSNSKDTNETKDSSECKSTICNTNDTNEYKCKICNTNDSYTDTDKDTDKDKEEDKADKPPRPSSPKDIEKVVDLYHSICKSFPKLKAMPDSRKKSIKARLGTYGMDTFRDVFTKVEASDFLRGQNDRKWAATFDWIIKESNFAKILDGNFDNKGESPPQYDGFDIEKYKQFINKF